MKNALSKNTSDLIIIFKWCIYFIIGIFLIILIPLSILITYQNTRTIQTPKLLKINNIDEIFERKNSEPPQENSSTRTSNPESKHPLKNNAVKSEQFYLKNSKNGFYKDESTSDSIYLSKNMFIMINDDLTTKQKLSAEKINQNYSALLKTYSDWEDIKANKIKEHKELSEYISIIYQNDIIIAEELRANFNIEIQKKWNDTFISLSAARKDYGFLVQHCAMIEPRFNNWDTMIYYCKKKGTSPINLALCMYVNYTKNKRIKNAGN